MGESRGVIMQPVIPYQSQAIGKNMQLIRLFREENQTLKQLRDAVVLMVVLWIEGFKPCT